MVSFFGTSIYGDYDYAVKADGTLAVTGYHGKSDDVVIPSKIQGRTVTEIGEKAFYQCDTITAVKIPEGVTKVGYCSFCQCESLAEVELPESLRIIYVCCFSNCTSLQTLHIPVGVEEIRDSAFCGCSGLRSISVPPVLKKISETAFEGCSSIEEVRISGGRTFFGRRTSEEILWRKGKDDFLIINDILFKYGGDNRIVEIPDGVKVIGSTLFYPSAKADCVIIPESVESIRKEAFANILNMNVIYRWGGEQLEYSISLQTGDGWQGYVYHCGMGQEAAAVLELLRDKDFNSPWIKRKDFVTRVRLSLDLAAASEEFRDYAKRMTTKALPQLAQAGDIRRIMLAEKLGIRLGQKSVKSTVSLLSESGASPEILAYLLDYLSRYYGSGKQDE